MNSSQTGNAEDDAVPDSDDTDLNAGLAKPAFKRSPRNQAMNWLARREHSCAELREKLVNRGFEPHAADQAVEQLAADGLVSDERFAEAFIAAKMRRGQGPVRIRAELKRRGVASELVHIHIEVGEHDWQQLAREVRAKKFGPELPAEFPAKAKQMRFLEYRGFSAEQIRAAVGDD